MPRWQNGALRGLAEPTEMTQGGRHVNRDWMLGDPCASPPACCLARPVGAGKPRRINRRDDVVLGQWMPLAPPEMVCRLHLGPTVSTQGQKKEDYSLFSRTLSQVNRTANYAASVDYDMTPSGRVHRRSRHPSRLALRTSPIFFVFARRHVPFLWCVKRRKTNRAAVTGFSVAKWADADHVVE